MCRAALDVPVSLTVHYHLQLYCTSVVRFAYVEQQVVLFAPHNKVIQYTHVLLSLPLMDLIEVFSTCANEYLPANVIKMKGLD